MLPIRCFSCNYIISKVVLQNDLKKMNIKECFEKYNLKYCCRNILLTQIDLNELITRN